MTGWLMHDHDWLWAVACLGFIGVAATVAIAVLVNRKPDPADRYFCPRCVDTPTVSFDSPAALADHLQTRHGAT